MPVPRSKQRAKPLDREAGVTGDTAHREGVDRIVSWDRHDAGAIRHDDVLALTRDPEARFLQRADCVEMIDAGDLGQA